MILHQRPSESWLVGGDRKWGRLFNVVDWVKKLEAEVRAGRQGRMAESLCWMDLVALDELGYLPFLHSVHAGPTVSCRSA